MPSLPSERTILAHHITPNDEIQLQRRSLPDGSVAFEIIANGVFLMASYNQVSERALAHFALEVVQSGPRSELRVLVGGLGMGFTVQELLSHDIASVDVVEICSHVVEWNRTYFSSLNQNVMADHRVKLIQEDVYAVMCASSPAAYDAILLDVDNGPSWLAAEKNSQLYTLNALHQWSAMLIPGGSFTVWSAQPEPALLERMQASFGRAEEITIVAASHRAKPVEHFLYRSVH